MSNEISKLQDSVTKKNLKFYNVEFLRFFFAISIVIYHLFTGWLPAYCNGIPLFHYTRDNEGLCAWS